MTAVGHSKSLHHHPTLIQCHLTKEPKRILMLFPLMLTNIIKCRHKKESNESGQIGMDVLSVTISTISLGHLKIAPFMANVRSCHEMSN